MGKGIKALIAGLVTFLFVGYAPVIILLVMLLVYVVARPARY